MEKENNFTTNDLLIEYMTLKIESGHEPKFGIDEFMEFLTFFEHRIGNHINYEKKDIIDISRHLTLEEGTVKANYLLNSYELDMHRTPSEVSQIKAIIKEYLKKIPKQEIVINEQVTHTELMKGRLVTAKMISYIWRDYIHALSQKQQWPKQCDDINTYLLEFDLAPVIGLSSIRDTTLDFYDVVSKRVSTLYSHDHDLRITSVNGSLLAYSNYLRLIRGYEKYVGISFDTEYHPFNNKKRLLSVDLSTDTFQEFHERDGFDIYIEDDHSLVRGTIDDPKTKQLIYSLGQTKRD